MVSLNNDVIICIIVKFKITLGKRYSMSTLLVIIIADFSNELQKMKTALDICRKKKS